MGDTRKKAKLRRREAKRWGDKKEDRGTSSINDANNGTAANAPKEAPAFTESYDRTRGRDLTANLSRTLFNDDYHAVGGFICNSYDASAHHVHITLEHSLDRLVIEDDGKGMGRQGLDSFFRNAGSVKKDLKVTEEGRIPIGNKGIETSAVVYLAEEFEISTWNDGSRREIKDKSPDDLDDFLKIKCEGYSDSRKKYGTRITLTGLKYRKEGRSFLIEDLKKRLARDMPISDDFRVFVNSEEIKQINMKTATEYILDRDTPTAGKVRGIFYVAKQTLPEDSRGVFLKVTGRTVTGMEDYWNVSSVSMALGSRLVAFVYADGLRKKVSSDWTRIEKGSQQFKEVDEAVRQMLKKVKLDYDGEQEQQRIRSVEERLSDKTQRTVERVRDSHPSLDIRDIKIPKGVQAKGIGDDIGYIKKEKDGSSTIVVNPRHIRTDSLDSSSLQAQLDDAVLVILSLHLFETEIKHKYKAAKTINEKLETIARWKELFLEQRDILHGNKKTLDEVLDGVSGAQWASLSEHRLYSDKDLQQKRGIDPLTIRRLVDCGALEYAKVNGKAREGMFFAKEVYKALEPARHEHKYFHTPLWMILRRIYTEETNFNTAEKIATSQLDAAREKGNMPDYMIRLGKDNGPSFYWVKKGFDDACVELLASDVLRRKTGRKTGEEEIDPDNMLGGKNNPSAYDPKKVYSTGEYVHIPEVGTVRVNYTYKDEGRFFVEDLKGNKIKEQFQMAKEK